MRAVFFGTDEFGIPSLEAIKKRHSLLAAVSTPDKPFGRSLAVRKSPVKEWASQHDIPNFDYRKEDPSSLAEPLKDMRADVFVVISFGGILKSDFLTLPRLYCLNVHGSLLPKYRGASPIQQSLLNGDTETGVTVMRMIERLDAGDVLLQKKTTVLSDETALELRPRLSELSAEALMEAMDQIERGNARFQVQAEAQASYTKKISKSDGKIDWGLPATVLHNRIRAFMGWPGSYFFSGSKRIAVWKAEVFSGKHPAATPGTVIGLSGAGLLVEAGDGTALLLKELQLEGKKRLPWKEFSLGFPLKAGDIFN